MPSSAAVNKREPRAAPCRKRAPLGLPTAADDAGAGARRAVAFCRGDPLGVRPHPGDAAANSAAQRHRSRTHAPGERLVSSALAEAIGAGQTPIREALMRLVSEGLVALEDQRVRSAAYVRIKGLPVIPDRVVVSHAASSLPHWRSHLPASAAEARSAWRSRDRTQRCSAGQG